MDKDIKRRRIGRKTTKFMERQSAFSPMTYIYIYIYRHVSVNIYKARERGEREKTEREGRGRERAERERDMMRGQCMVSWNATDLGA